VNSLEFSNKGCLIQNARLIRAYEAIKEEFLEEKKVRISIEIEKGKEIEKLRNICSEMAFDLREKTEILEEIKKKNEDLQSSLKDLIYSNKIFNENKENSHKDEKKEKLKTKTMDFSNKFSKILENKKIDIDELKKEFDSDLLKINERIEEIKFKESEIIIEDIEEFIESYKNSLQNHSKFQSKLDAKTINLVFFQFVLKFKENI